MDARVVVRGAELVPGEEGGRWEARARASQSALGRVGPQPVSVRSFTNRRFTACFTAPRAHVQRLLPAEMEADPVPSRPELGMVGMCACDFWVSHLGPVPIWPVRNSDMLLRVSARFRKGGRRLRGFYTIASRSSSRLLGTLGRYFSHFRKRVAAFERVEDERVYVLRVRGEDELSPGWLVAHKDTLDAIPERGSVFADIDGATDYVFRLDGSCGFDWSARRISFQPIEYPEWRLSFCHGFEYRFPLLETVAREFALELRLDCVLAMQDTHQVWCRSSLFRDGEPSRPWYAK